MLHCDASQAGSDRLFDPLARALRIRDERAVTAAESCRGGEFMREEVQFLARAACAFGVGPRGGFFEFLL